jgi:hypothetical protein
MGPRRRERPLVVCGDSHCAKRWVLCAAWDIDSFHNGWAREERLECARYMREVGDTDQMLSFARADEVAHPRKVAMSAIVCTRLP